MERIATALFKSGLHDKVWVKLGFDHVSKLNACRYLLSDPLKIEVTCQQLCNIQYRTRCLNETDRDEF